MHGGGDSSLSVVLLCGKELGLGWRIKKKRARDFKKIELSAFKPRRNEIRTVTVSTHTDCADTVRGVHCKEHRCLCCALVWTVGWAVGRSERNTKFSLVHLLADFRHLRRTLTNKRLQWCVGSVPSLAPTQF